MSEPQYQEVFLDLIPNMLNIGGEKEREQSAALLRQQVERALPHAVARWAKIPPIAVALGPHVDLLAEARALYIHGYFYSCVAQCGITSERILKDLMARSLRVVVGVDAPKELPLPALKHLDWFDQSRIAKFLTECGVITTDVRKAALDLATLRNEYAHGSGTNPEADALKAIGFLHAIVEGTVSMFGKMLAHPTKVQ